MAVCRLQMQIKLQYLHLRSGRRTQPAQIFRIEPDQCIKYCCRLINAPLSAMQITGQ